jgi:hypothetical protein
MAVRDIKPPSTVQEIRQFIGLCNFFRSHVRNFATISAPLSRLFSKEASWKGRDLPANCLESFYSLINALISEPIVDYPRKLQTLFLDC